MLSNYKSYDATYDEMLGADGAVNEHWKSFVQYLSRRNFDERQNLNSETNRILQENGVTYNLHGDPEGMNRPWQLDAVPLILSESDWRSIETGLKQRVKLLNLILKDIYGKRELIKRALLPLELIYSHNGFLRPCDNNEFGYMQELFIYAADLGRGPDGKMWVINDRTQAPSGLGYAVENRTALAKIYPNLIRTAKIKRLSSYFSSLRTFISSIRVNDRMQPRIVLLTPGPYNETYFEHAYLSNYLGYPLVQGKDLTVRNNKVWFKSIDGLQQIDIIIRRVDDFYCDPLELKYDSQLGVPGLLEAVRMGNVVVINPLGSSVLENPGIYAFLPSICRHLLDEELILPTAATWWCGQQKELQYVIDNFDNLVIKTIHREPDYGTTFVKNLNSQKKEQLRNKILSRPHMYIGQEKVSFSTSPSLLDGELKPRYTVLRCFLSKNTEEEYSIMPGGLTRSSSNEKNPYVSNQQGGFAKDTWVVSHKPEEHMSLWLQPQVGDEYFADAGMLSSSAAEDLYWVGRYSERAERTAHFLKLILDKYFEHDEYTAEEKQSFTYLLGSLTLATQTYPGFVGKGEKKLFKRPESELLSLLTDYNRAGTLAFNLKSFQRTAYSVRDRWSLSTWRIINSIDKHWSAACRGGDVNLTFLRSEMDQLLTLLLAFVGYSAESMTRKSGWIILEFGKRLERSLFLINLIKSNFILRHDEFVEYLLLEALLGLNESLITYRSRYRSMPSYKNVFDLLLFDDKNPRSLVYQISRIEYYLSFLPRTQKENNKLSAKEKLILNTSTQIKIVDLEYLCEFNDKTKSYDKMNDFLNSVQSQLLKVSDSLSQEFFTHTPPTSQLLDYRGILNNEIRSTTHNEL